MRFDIEQDRSRLSELERADVSEVKQDIADLARPRMTGTEGAAETDEALRQRFEGLGYEVEPLDFSLSTFPGRFGITVAGVLVLLTAVGGTWLLLIDQPIVSLVVLFVGIALALLPLLLLNPASSRLPWQRVDAHNLLFTPAGSRPQWIVMAHRDTKGQLVPTLIRTGAVVAGVAAWVLLVVLAALWIGGELLQFPTAVWIAGAVLALAGLLLALSWATNRSPGALDNATGLAALLAVAKRTGGNGNVAYLITDAEELGLLGARAAADRLPPIQGVINLDGLDDDGTLYVAEGHGWTRKGSAPQLAAALLSAGAALDLSVTRRRLPRSIMVDHVPIAAAGIPALTVLRGSWSSLMRVHRAGDSADGLSGRGAAEGATLVAAALTLLGDSEAPDLASRRASGS